MTSSEVEVRPQSVIFRVWHGFGATAFAPRQALRGDLLKAAGAAGLIEIRGRTDGTVDNAGERYVARARADKAAAWLVANGIPATRIRVTSLGVGGRLATNDTGEGRALNRRVEVEAMDLEPAQLALRTTE